MLNSARCSITSSATLRDYYNTTSKSVRRSARSAKTTETLFHGSSRYHANFPYPTSRCHANFFHTPLLVGAMPIFPYTPTHRLKTLDFDQNLRRI